MNESVHASEKGEDSNVHYTSTPIHISIYHNEVHVITPCSRRHCQPQVQFASRKDVNLMFAILYILLSYSMTQNDKAIETWGTVATKICQKDLSVILLVTHTLRSGF